MRFLLLPLLAALVLAAGCGGGDGDGDGDDGGDESSAPAWADDFCSAAADWRTSLEDVVSGISPSDLSADGVRDAIDEGIEATEEFVDEIRGLDAPETEAGLQVAETVDGMADSVEATADELGAIFAEGDSLQDLIEKVPQAVTQITQLEDELQTSLAQLEDLDTGELRDELSSSEDCAAARSGSGP